MCICIDWRQTAAAAPKFYHGCMSGFVRFCQLLNSHAYENGRHFHNSQTQPITTTPKSARKTNQEFEFYTKIPDNLHAQCEDLLTETSHKQSVNIGFRIYGLTNVSSSHMWALHCIGDWATLRPQKKLKTWNQRADKGVEYNLEVRRLRSWALLRHTHQITVPPPRVDILACSSVVGYLHLRSKLRVNPWRLVFFYLCKETLFCAVAVFTLPVINNSLVFGPEFIILLALVPTQLATTR